MCEACSSLGQKWGNERAITGSKIILTCPNLSPCSGVGKPKKDTLLWSYRSFWWPAAFRGTPKIIWMTEKFCLSFCQQFNVSIFQFFLKFCYCLLRHSSTIQKQVHFEILCLLKRARIGVFLKGTSFVHQNSLSKNTLRKS